MYQVGKGFKMVGAGVVKILTGILLVIVNLVNGIIRAWRKRLLKWCTAYVSKWGYELALNSRVKVNGKAYYVLSYTSFENIGHDREVAVNLIGVPQYKEIMRRSKGNDN